LPSSSVVPSIRHTSQPLPNSSHTSLSTAAEQAFASSSSISVEFKTTFFFSRFNQFLSRYLSNELQGGPDMFLISEPSAFDYRNYEIRFSSSIISEASIIQTSVGIGILEILITLLINLDMSNCKTTPNILVRRSFEIFQHIENTCHRSFGR